MAYMKHVPVMFMNQQIGSARVHDTGEIEIISRPNELGEQIYHWIEMGLASGMCVTMITEPAKQAPI